MSEEKYDKIMSIAKRRGFIWPSFEIYGGAGGFYDFGPLGSALKEKILNKWRQHYVVKEGSYEIDSPTIFPEDVLKASGHVDHFTDFMVECSSCGSAYEITNLVKEMTGKDIEGLSKEKMKEVIQNQRVTCPSCGGSLGDIYDFNTMFKTAIGPEGEKVAYLRPETAQSIFVDFNRLQRVARRKLPFGVAQIGKGYRNEISPRKGIIRLREFTMAEVEVFFNPNYPEHPKFERVEDESLRLWLAKDQESGSDEIKEVTTGKALENGMIYNELLAYHMAYSKQFLLKLGIPEKMIRLREQVPGERAHYSKETWDLEVYTENFGWVEVAGMAYRTDYDLSQHSEFSDTDMTVFHQKSGEEGERVLPHVVEPSFGIDRCLYCTLEHSYAEEGDKKYFKIKADLAPIEVGVFPLITSDGLPEKAEKVFEELKNEEIFSRYDDSGSIGKRYARADEIGVPFCVTVDHQTLEDDTVTIRDRDTTDQIRVDVGELPLTIRKLLKEKVDFETAGEPV